MSKENVEIARKIHDAFNHEGWEGIWHFADPEIEFCEPPEQPGATVFRGIEAVREGVARSWQQTWLEQRSEVQRLVDLGDRVLLLAVQHLRGRDGIEVSQPGGNILTFRNGKVLRLQAFWNQRAALEAAGLAE